MSARVTHLHANYVASSFKGVPRPNQASPLIAIDGINRHMGARSVEDAVGVFLAKRCPLQSSQPAFLSAVDSFHS